MRLENVRGKPGPTHGMPLPAVTNSPQLRPGRFHRGPETWLGHSIARPFWPAPLPRARHATLGLASHHYPTFSFAGSRSSLCFEA
jgi:hypothetical protein